MFNPIDKAIALLSPTWALERAKARHLLQAYEAAQSNRLRKPGRERRTGNSAVRLAAKDLREQARWLDESHDLVAGILDCFVNNVVGPHGIAIEPQPRSRNGELHTEVAEQIQQLLHDYSLLPEVTMDHDRAGTERLACLTWARDGECFAQQLTGDIAGLEHNTRVPYSLELIEPDRVPFNLDDISRGIVQGIEVNTWNRARAFHVYKFDPNERATVRFETKRIPADRMLHIKTCRRIGQLRGVSRLATILTRLQDLKEYEDAERIAAKIASATALYVKKGTPDLYSPPDSDELDDANRRLMQVAPGMMWVDLQAGEEVGTVDTSRPSNLLQPFRDAMLKAAATGAGVSYATVSKNYDGNFSSQRQALIEQFVIYAVNQGHFINQWTRPDYQTFIATALSSRRLRLPADMDPLTVDDAVFRGPVMPWIDPQKEAQANILQVQAGFKSRAQVIRERGGVPQNVRNEIAMERADDEERGLTFSTDWATQARNVLDTIEETETDLEDAA